MSKAAICIMYADVPLAKSSHMPSPESVWEGLLEGSTQGSTLRGRHGSLGAIEGFLVLYFNHY